MGYFSELDIEGKETLPKKVKKEDTVYSLAQKIILLDSTEELEDLLNLSLKELKLKKQRLELQRERAVLIKERNYRNSIRRPYSSSSDLEEMNGYGR